MTGAAAQATAPTAEFAAALAAQLRGQIGEDLAVCTGRPDIAPGTSGLERTETRIIGHAEFLWRGVPVTVVTRSGNRHDDRHDGDTDASNSDASRSAAITPPAGGATPCVHDTRNVSSSSG